MNVNNTFWKRKHDDFIFFIVLLLVAILLEDLCEDSDAKMRIIELVDAVKHKKKLLQILHERTGVSDKASGRRMSSHR